MSNKKKNVGEDASVKIVGINHKMCLAYTLLLEGWKCEQFADVTFYCRAGGGRRRTLRANRSVLAAASPFFARLLPRCELESDVCVTTELTYDEMFCVLEYLYSGKLVCSEGTQQRLLAALREFQVFVPDTLKYPVEKNAAEVEIITMQHATEPGPANHPDPIRSSELRAVPAPRIYRNKRKIAKAATTATVPQTADPQTADPPTSAPPMAARLTAAPPAPVTSKSPEENLPGINASFSNRDGVTVRVPNFLRSCTSEDANTPGLEKAAIETSAKTPKPSQYPLPLYLSQTWRCGIYSGSSWTAPEQSAAGKRVQQRPAAAASDEVASNLSSQVKNVYTRGSARKRIMSKSVSEEVLCRVNPDTHNVKHHNGKVHVTVNAPARPPPPPPPLPPPQEPQVSSVEPPVEEAQVAEEAASVSSSSTSDDSSSCCSCCNGSSSSDESVKSSHSVELEKTVEVVDLVEAETAEEDEACCARAKLFLQEEVCKKKRVQMRIRRLNNILNQYKKVAREILDKKKEMEKNGLLDGGYRPLPTKKRSKVQVQCEQCGKMILASRLSIHLKTHGGVKSHLCELCGRAFLLKAYLNAHIRINHRGNSRPKRFMCSSCGYTCDQKHKLEVHERVHTDERPFDCQYCDKKFREKGTLKRHIRTHTGEKPYECNICGTAYAARDTYVQHYKRKHAPRPDGAAAAEQQRPRNKHSNVVIYRCEFCQKGFYRVLAYEKHRATHTGVAAAVPCSQSNCDFTYSDMTQLKDHMAVCHPGKIYTCSICSKVFLTKQNLVNHQAKHDPNLGFHCSHCSLSLTTRASLIAHEKTHTREKPYVCPYCGMSFHSPYLMKIHERKHQPNAGKRNRSKQAQLVEEEQVEYY